MPGGGTITITAREEIVPELVTGGMRPGFYVCISVADGGTGMDEETLARAVEPFFTTKGVGKGTGLGLSMVHGLAEQSGGTFKLQSRLGHGTTAEIWLPEGEIEPAAPAQAAAPVPAKTHPDVDSACGRRRSSGRLRHHRHAPRPGSCCL
jgi:signal transduction histidine kinase